MNENEFDGLSDNDWDESWDFAWTEFDWEKHLQEQDKTTHRYLAHYEKVIERGDRIDEVAHLMGWDQDGWTNDDGEGSAASDESESPEETSRPPGAQGFDPYTIQKHPVYISTHSLFFWLHRAWDFLAPACGPKVPMRTALGFAGSLSRAEHYGLLAVHSLDMGDFSLVVCQIKRGMSELNSALRTLQMIEDSIHPAVAQFRHQALTRLFDIREIWLRVMRDCREELDRRVSEEEN
ncbi:MAG: hypothetical protein IAE82_18045 [Opitutaceae bacterium]|nr:hypothetical protein [Opitutaceae bacterium]